MQESSVDEKEIMFTVYKVIPLKNVCDISTRIYKVRWRTKYVTELDVMVAYKSNVYER